MAAPRIVISMLQIVADGPLVDQCGAACVSNIKISVWILGVKFSISC